MTQISVCPRCREIETDPPKTAEPVRLCDRCQQEHAGQITAERYGITPKETHQDRQYAEYRDALHYAATLARLIQGRGNDNGTTS